MTQYERKLIHTLMPHPNGLPAYDAIALCCAAEGIQRYNADGAECKFAENLRYARLRLVNAGIMHPHQGPNRRVGSLWKLI